MSSYLIVGETGADYLLLVDTGKLTVKKIEKSDIDPTIASLRANGASVTNGVDVAIAAPDRPGAVGRFFFGSEAVQ